MHEDANKCSDWKSEFTRRISFAPAMRLPETDPRSACPRGPRTKRFMATLVMTAIMEIT